MAWVRKGECCRCGQCCRGGIDGYPAQEDGSCPYLEKEHDGQRLCSIHDTVDTYWARGCVVWPTIPAHIQDYEKCTYSFEWVDE